MAIITLWNTVYPTTQDTTIAPLSNQPELTNDVTVGDGTGDIVLTDHLHALRDKLQAVALEVGTVPANLPAGCLRARVQTLEDTPGGSGDAVSIQGHAVDATTPAAGDLLTYDDAGLGTWKHLPSSGTSSDINVKISATDTTTSYLDSKVVGANGIVKSILTPSGNEQLQIAPTYGTLVNTICQGNDSRLSDSRDAISIIGHVVDNTTPADGDVLTYDVTGLGTWKHLAPTVYTDISVKVSATDTTTSYLTNKVVVANGLTKAILTPSGNEQVQLSPTYGALVNTICQGNDSRLSDSRTPIAHYLTHQLAGGDAINVAGLSGVLADKQDADKLQGVGVVNTAPTSDQALVYKTGSSKWEPTTLSTGFTGDALLLQGRTLANTAPSDGQAVAWNTALSQWEPQTVSGGSSQENIPVLSSVSGSTFSFVKQAGASSTLWVKMNTGTFYSATAPLAMNISTTGLGGRETSATFYGEATGAGDSWSAPDGFGYQTITDAAGLFTANMAGTYIDIATTGMRNRGLKRIVSYTSATQIVVDNPAGVVETSSSAWTIAGLCWFYNYAVPDPGSPGTFNIILSKNAPDVGPADYVAWRYLGAILYRGSSLLLRPVNQIGHHFYFSDLSDNTLSVYYQGGSGANPTVNAWHNTLNIAAGVPNTFTAVSKTMKAVVPVVTTGEVYLSAFVDEDTGSSGLVIDTGDVLYSTVAMTYTAYGSRMFAAAETNGSTPNRSWIPFTQGELYFNWAFGAGVEWDVAALGYSDKYLLNRMSAF